jgi:hypothetical protein
VVDDKAWVVGILSLNDIVLARTRTLISSTKERFLGDVAQTLGAICQHRSNGHTDPGDGERREGAPRAVSP